MDCFFSPVLKSTTGSLIGNDLGMTAFGGAGCLIVLTATTLFKLVFDGFCTIDFGGGAVLFEDVGSTLTFVFTGGSNVVVGIGADILALSSKTLSCVFLNLKRSRFFFCFSDNFLFSLNVILFLNDLFL